MAIDTAAKRASTFNFCNPFDAVTPIPDASIVAADRQHLWGLYSGISISVLITNVRWAAFNFCNPFDHILPRPGTAAVEARSHLWGLYTDISIDPAVGPTVGDFNYLLYARSKLRR